MKLSDQITRRQLFLVAFGTSQATGGLTSVDLAATRDDSQVVLTASDGSAAPISGADAAVAGVMTAADKAKLDDLSQATFREFTARSQIPSASIGAAVTHLRTAGYAAAGDGGGAVYARAGSEPAHALKVQSADGAWWELVPQHGYISVRQAGAVGNDAADDGQAFIDALNGVEDFNSIGANDAIHGVRVPPGSYYLGANTLEIKKAVHLVGSGSGRFGRQPARLRWDANVTGIIVHRGNTIGATTESTGTGAGDGSIIEGLNLLSAGGTIAGISDDTKGHGIWLRAAAMLRDISVQSFAGNGIHILADMGAGGATEGNANLWRIDTCRAAACHMSGLYVDGPDVNAGVAVGLDVSSNGRWGIWDSSFLGNTYVGGHVATNGLATLGENGSGESSFVEYGGIRYAANVAATESDLVATQPGTDENVWIEIEAGNSNSRIPTWQSGQPEGTYFHGGSYHTDNANARNVLINCYDETDTAPAQMRKPTLIYGGHGMHRSQGTFGGFEAGANRATWYGSLDFKNHQAYAPDRDLTLRLNRNVSQLLTLHADGDNTQGLSLGTWHEVDGHWVVRHGNLAGRTPLTVTTDLNQLTYGRSATSDVGSGQLTLPNGYWLGGWFTGRYRQTAGGPPGSGYHARGDLYENYNPTGEGEPLGWVCIGAGNPGSWAEIRGIGTQTSGADQAALTNSTGGTRDGTVAAVSGTGDDATINDNLTELHTLLDEVRTTLVSFGLMKGGA